MSDHDPLCRHGNSTTVAVVTTEGDVLPAFTEDEFDECWECDLIASVRSDEELRRSDRTNTAYRLGERDMLAKCVEVILEAGGPSAVLAALRALGGSDE